MADFVDSIVGHADPWKLRWFLSPAIAPSPTIMPDGPIIFASPERAEPAARQSMRTCSALSGLWRIGAAGYSARWRTTQGGAALYPGLSHYAPLGRTIRLRIGVDRTLQATQVVVGYSGWRLPDGPMPQRGGGIAGSLNAMVLCPNGAQGDSPGQSEAPPWDSLCPKQPKP